MIVNNNPSAKAAWGALNNVRVQQSKVMERLSTGLRINTAGDDAAGLAVSEKMRSQIKGFAMARRNAQDAISLIQTAEGALSESHNILQRLRELAVQSANDTLTDADRAQLQKEADELVEELDRIATTTEFNTKNLLDGSVANQTKTATVSVGNDTVITGHVVKDVVAFDGQYTLSLTTDAYEIRDEKGRVIQTGTYDDTGGSTIEFAGVTLTVAGGQAGQSSTITLTAGYAAGGTDNSLKFQIGANAHQTTDLAIDDMSAKGLGMRGFGGNFDISTREAAERWIAITDKAIEKVSGQRAILGAKQNRLESTITSLQISEQNIQAAESRIRDADMAAEMMQFTRLNILQQTGTAMLANANAAPQSVLALF